MSKGEKLTKGFQYLMCVGEELLSEGVTLRVTTTITGSTSFTVGDGSDVDAWGTGITQIAGDNTTGADFTIVTVPIYAAVTSVVLTSTGGSFTAGAVRLTVHYMDFTAATS